MVAYQNKRTGVILREETYNQLSYSEKIDFVRIQAEEKRDSNGDFALSAIIGAATGSAILGGLLGGNIMGGMLGDMFDGDLFD